MFILNNMTFQYFFFNTYPGYFLQVLPIALIAGGIYAFFHFRRGGASLPASQKLGSVLFVCYLSGLLCLTLFSQPLGELWYRLLYGMPGGRHIRFFEWTFNFVPSIFSYLGGDGFGNILLFLPFGVLYTTTVNRFHVQK